MNNTIRHFAMSSALPFVLILLALAPLQDALTQELRELSSAPACTACRIVVEPRVTLALPAESLSFGPGRSFARLRNGSFVVSGLNETRVPALLDQNGRFVRLIARSGSGPGEIRTVDAMVIAPEDSVWLLQNGKATIFSPTMEFARETRIFPASAIVPLSNGRIVVGGSVPTPASAGFPLHLIDSTGVVLKSFGIADPTLDPRRLIEHRDSPETYLHRDLIPGTDNTFWAYNQTRFLLEKWSTDGRLLAQARHRLDGWYAEASAAEPGQGDYKGLRLWRLIPSSDSSLLWLVYVIRNQNWRTPTAEQFRTAMPTAGMYDAVIEAVDTNNMRVLAVMRLPGANIRSIVNGPDSFVRYKPVGQYFSEFVVHTLTLARPR